MISIVSVVAGPIMVLLFVADSYHFASNTCFWPIVIIKEHLQLPVRRVLPISQHSRAAVILKFAFLNPGTFASRILSF